MSEPRYVDELRTSYEAELARLRNQYAGVKEDLRICRENKKARVDELTRLRERVRELETKEAAGGHVNVSPLSRAERKELARLRAYAKYADQAGEELGRLREELISSGNDKEYQEQQWRADNARLREEKCDLTERLNEAIHDLDERRNALKEPNAGLAEIERIRLRRGRQGD